jgi:alpha-amylase
MLRSVQLTATCAVAALGLMLPAAPVSADEATRVARHSLRAGLTEENFYFVMGDRFENGDTANDRGGLSGDRDVTGFDPTSKAFYNGGDLAGLQSRLDYVKRMGTTSIWLTPIFKNKAVQLEDGPSAGYHGYWITDFTQVDPHLGTNAELRGLVKSAHAKGIKVFFDIITNHTADVVGYEEGARTAYVSKDARPYRTATGRPFDDRDFAGTDRFPALDPEGSFPYRPRLDDSEESLKKPDWLNNPRFYHNRGNTTFTGEDALYGDFFGLDDLFTEHPRVVRGMTDIYKTWVGDFGIDGFRIDTMKHVNDEFWQAFGPGIVTYARAHGRPDFFMFGEVFDDRTDTPGAAFRSHFTTHDRMQAVLDFGFQAAARNFASKGTSARDLRRFFRGDDWYTDRNSNAYALPTFLGNHDMGRLGFFVKSDNPGASEAEWMARDRLAHQLMYFSRGNPVVYYGDEQGFTGSGGDQLARQDMFPSEVNDWPANQDLDNLGSAETPADDNFDTDHPLFEAIARLARVTKRFPALRNGAQQMRHADTGPGLVSFSRIDRRHQREYVVALNNSTSERSAAIRTFTPRSDWTQVFGAGRRELRSGRGGLLRVTVPPLSTVVYRAERRIPRSAAAPRIRLDAPHPARASHGRVRVRAEVGGSSFYEVTFQAKVGTGAWRSIGTDDSRPYRVFHDTSNLRTGRAVRYRAVVLDNSGHARMSGVRSTRVQPPHIAVTAPARGGTVTNIDPVTVTANVDPERASQSVRFQRSVAGGDWESIGVDRSSPVYTTTDDVSDLPLGTAVRYRAVLREWGHRVASRPVGVTTAEPKPARNSVTIAGSLQSELRCPDDWQPDCSASHLTFDPSDGLWHGTFTLPEGSYAWKVAINDSWNENYGQGGAAGGSDLTLDVPSGGRPYVFTWNQVSHVPSVEPAP